MRKETVTKEMFIAADESTFDTEAECVAYESARWNEYNTLLSHMRYMKSFSMPKKYDKVRRLNNELSIVRSGRYASDQNRKIAGKIEMVGALARHYGKLYVAMKELDEDIQKYNSMKVEMRSVADAFGFASKNRKR